MYIIICLDVEGYSLYNQTARKPHPPPLSHTNRAGDLAHSCWTRIKQQLQQLFSGHHGSYWEMYPTNTWLSTQPQNRYLNVKAMRRDAYDVNTTLAWRPTRAKQLPFYWDITRHHTRPITSSYRLLYGDTCTCTVLNTLQKCCRHQWPLRRPTDARSTIDYSTCSLWVKQRNAQRTIKYCMSTPVAKFMKSITN